MSTTTTAVNKNTKERSSRENPKEPHIIPLTCIRILVLYIIYLAYVKADIIQSYIDVTWSWLRHQRWYEIVYFETFLVPFWAVPALFPYRLIHRTGIGETYRIEKTGGEYGLVPTHKNILRETLEYTWPFFILDTFHVKHYAGVPDDVINVKRLNWIQRTRALPEFPPQLGDMVRHLVVALVLYDLCFFLSHYTFHKHALLYKLFHAVHHEHKSVNAKVANQLHVVERIILVLSANFGLKVQGAHPLTRTVFVFLFLSVLIDNHSGYDFPYSYDKILPRGLIAGPRKHYEHHVHGSRNYQPFLTYIDNTLEWYRKRRKLK